MSGQIFPVLPGLGWSVHKRPSFSTRIATHVSGRELRSTNWSYPLWEYELTYDVLRADTLSAELQQLCGFFLARQGQFDSFFFNDPTDNYVAGQHLGIGDGVTTSFTFLRSFGGWTEPVGHVAQVNQVYLNGAPVQGFSAAEPNILNFQTAPATGQVITADFGYWFVCRFTEDIHDYENFLTNLWTLKSCKMRSVKP